MSSKTTDSLKTQVLNAARQLFMAHGYDTVGMRDIAKAVGKQPVQVYRLHLSKADILAELAIELNQEQINRLPEISKGIKATDLFERTCEYLHELYKQDIHYLPIRSISAAFGWTWTTSYEQKIVEQVLQLLQPLAGWMNKAGMGGIEARCYGIWSVYYVGFRRAAIHAGSAEDCIQEIRPTLEILLRT